MRFLIKISEAVDTLVYAEATQERIPTGMHNRIAHYALCLLQLQLYHEHPTRSSTREALALRIAQTGHSTIRSNSLSTVDCIESALGHTMVQDACGHAGIDEDLVDRISRGAFAQLIPNISSINPAWLVDLSLMAIVCKEPEAAIKILAEGFRRGALPSGRVRSKPQHAQTPRLLERLVLQQEFEHLAIGTWASMLDVRATAAGRNQSQLNVIGPPQITLALPLFRSRSGRRALKEFLDWNDPPQIKFLPRRAEDDVSHELSYATAYMRAVLFSADDSGAETFVKNDKVRSIIAALQVMTLDNQGKEDVGVFYGAEETRDSIVGRVINNLGNEYGFPYTSRALYRAYGEVKNGIFKRYLDKWHEHLHQQSSAHLPWYMLQVLATEEL